MQDEPEVGPIDYLVMEFPDGQVSAEAFAHVTDLVERGIIYVLDLEFVTKDADGTTRVVEAADLPGGALASYGGASSHLLDAADLDVVGGLVDAGSVAAILVYENMWAEALATTLRRSQARLVSSGQLPLPEVLSAFDQAEAATP